MARKTLKEENAQLQVRIKSLEDDLQGMEEMQKRCAEQNEKLFEKNRELSNRLQETITEMAYDEAQSRAIIAAHKAQAKSLSSSIYHLMNDTFYSEEETADQTTDS